MAYFEIICDIIKRKCSNVPQESRLEFLTNFKLFFKSLSVDETKKYLRVSVDKLGIDMPPEKNHRKT